MISSNAISSHSTDADALAACVAAASCYGIVYAPANSESTRWSARLGGESVGLFPMNGVTSYVYSGSCRRRLSEERVEMWSTEEEEPVQINHMKRMTVFGRMLRAVMRVPDMEEHKILTRRPAAGPLYANRPTMRLERNNRDSRM